jgi:hypothetical protein
LEKAFRHMQVLFEEYPAGVIHSPVQSISIEGIQEAIDCSAAAPSKILVGSGDHGLDLFDRAAGLEQTDKGLQSCRIGGPT